MQTETISSAATISSSVLVGDQLRLDGDKQQSVSRETYLSLPEGTPCQFITGEVVMTPSPVPVHQNIVGHLYLQLIQYVEKQNMGQVFIAPLDISLDENNIFQPDILYISRENESIIGETMIEGVPDLVVEVLSSSTAYYDLRTKFRAYEACGVKEYWIVDPERKSVEVFTSNNEKFHLQQEVEGEGNVRSEILSGFSVNLDAIFP